MEKLNLTQQKHTFTNQNKHTTHNKHKKTKAGFNRLLRHPAWKRSTLLEPMRIGPLKAVLGHSRRLWNGVDIREYA